MACFSFHLFDMSVFLLRHFLNLAIVVNLYIDLAIVEINPLNLAKIVNLHLVSSVNSNIFNSNVGHVRDNIVN